MRQAIADSPLTIWITNYAELSIGICSCVSMTLQNLNAVCNACVTLQCWLCVLA